MKCFLSKWLGRDRKSSNTSVLIKDYASKDKNTAASTSQAVALHGSAESREQAVARKKDPAERFTESVDKLVEKLEGINDNLSRQTKQNEYLVKKLEDLPRLLSPLPAAVNQQRDALVEMIEQLRRKAERDEAVAQTLSRLPELAGRQTESLEAIEDHLSTAADTDEKLTQTFQQVSESLGKLDAEVNGEIEWLQKMSQSFTENEKFLRDTLTAQQRKFFRLFAVVVGVSLAAITALVVILLLFLYR
jgi:chromosome segregation ATPase